MKGKRETQKRVSLYLVMFYKKGILYRSSLLDKYEKYGVRHGFSTREGGYSTLPHTKSLNLTFNLGDDWDTVLKNFDVFASSISDELTRDSVITAHQIHSAKVRIVDRHNAGEGISKDRGEDCDGFVTSDRYVLPVIRVADCTPILLCGLDENQNPVVSSVHAGWRGTVGGIAGEAVEQMVKAGAVRETISAAIGAHIGLCCFEVGEDFVEAVADLRGADFADRHIKREGFSKPHADLTSMNKEILAEAGVTRIDVSPHCTMCSPEDLYYSHRRMNGKRGTMGAGIAII